MSMVFAGASVAIGGKSGRIEMAKRKRCCKLRLEEADAPFIMFLWESRNGSRFYEPERKLVPPVAEASTK